MASSTEAKTRSIFAGAGPRALALAIDLMVVFVAILAVKLALEVAGVRTPAWLGYALVTAYFAGLPLTRLQGTPGKRGSSVKIHDTAGNPLGAGRCTTSSPARSSCLRKPPRLKSPTRQWTVKDYGELTARREHGFTAGP